MKGATPIQTATYTRDAAGRITAIDGNRTEDDWSYGYDPLDRLLTATNGGTPVLSQTFTYDLGGKLASNSAVGTYTYPIQAVRLSSRMRCRQPVAGALPTISTATS